MRLITLGDSLTANDLGWFQSFNLPDKNTNWAYYLSKHLNVELINFGLVGSQNSLQVQILQRWLLDNELNNDDIVIWQIGKEFDNVVTVHPDMYSKVEKMEKRIQDTVYISHRYFHETNKIDNQQHVSLFFTSPLHKKLCRENHPNPEANVLQDMLFMFLMIKKMCPNLLILRGGDFAMSEEHWQNVKNFLNEKSIDFLETSIVTWCIDNDLEFFEDSMLVKPPYLKGHPASESSNQYALKELIPNLKRLGWI